MGFSLIIAVWLFVASSCVTMGGVHLLIWIRERSRSSLWFSISAFSNAALGVFELGLMRSKSPAVYGELIRWGHVPLFLMLAALVLLVRSFSGAGRLWLAASTIAARGVSSIVVNFLHSPNLNFSEITGVRQVTFLGEFVSVAVGRVSPWTRVGEAASLVLLVFLVDATATAWRRRRRKALFVAGSAIVFVLIAVINSSLFVHGPAGPQRPYLISVPYFVILLAMGYELSSDLLRAADLARRLDSSEERLLESDRRLALAAEAVDLGFWTWDARADEMWMTATGRELRGFARDERLNLSRFLSSVDREDREAIRQTIEVAGAKGIAFEREYRIVRPDGEIRWVFLRGRGERDAGGGSARVRV